MQDEGVQEEGGQEEGGQDRPRPEFRSRRRHLLLGLALSAAALAAALVWLPGIGLRYGLVRALTDLGWSHVSVLKADVSLFNGAVVIHRLRAGEEAGGPFGIDGLDIDFNWRPLFSRRVSLDRLDLKGVTVSVRRDGDGFVVNGLPLPAGAGNAAESGPGWSYDVGALSLSDSRIAYADGTLAADIQVDSLTLENLRSWQPDIPARFHLAGRLNGAPITLDGTATPFAEHPRVTASLNVKGLDAVTLAEVIRKAGGGSLSGRLDGAMTLSGGLAADDAVTVAGDLVLRGGGWSLGGTKVAAAELHLDGADLSWRQGRLAASGGVTAKDLVVEDGGVTSRAGLARLGLRSAVYDAKTGKLTWDGTLHAERHSIAVGDTRLEHATLDWDGSSRMDLSAKAESFVHAEGKASTGGIRIVSGDMVLQAAVIRAEGVFEHARPHGMLPPLAGHMTLSAEQVQVSEGDIDWLSVGRAEIAGLMLDPGRQATLDRAEVTDLRSLARRGADRYRWRFEAGRAVLEKASMAADGSGTAGSLALDGAVIRVTQTKDGILGLPGSGGGGNADQPMPRQRLRQLRLTGDSRIDFIDRTLSEPVRLRLDNMDAVVSDLDTGRPNQDSRFSASARVGAASLSVKGRAQPFAAVPGGEVKGSVHALDLPALSPYAADTLGISLQTGQLDADIDLSASKGKLDGGMQLTLSELFVSQPDPNAPLAKRADMPVETVLDLLRDSDNRIRLSIPVRGDLSNPDFDFSDAVGQAVGGALRTTVFTTLKVAFPLAGLISLVIDDGDGRRLALEPLAFAAGDDELPGQARERLSEVARLMRQRPALKLNLCGVASESADWPALQERRRTSLLGRLQALASPDAAAEEQPDRDRLLRLADARAQAAKVYLSGTGGIDPGRLFACRGRIDGEKEAKPRVELLL